MYFLNFETKLNCIKDNKIVYGFSQTQQYILFYLCLDMLRSIDHHQALCAKHNQVHAVQKKIKIHNVN